MEENNNDIRELRSQIQNATFEDSTNVPSPSSISSFFNSRSLATQEERDNVFLGILGAMLYGSLGMFVWVCMGYAGFIAGIAGFLIVNLSIIGYKKFGGTLDAKGVVICLIISTLAIILSEFIVVVLLVHSVLKSEYELYTLTDSWIDSIYLLQNAPGFAGTLVRDLLIGFVLTFISTARRLSPQK